MYKSGGIVGKGGNPPVPGAKRRTRGRTSRLHYFLCLIFLSLGRHRRPDKAGWERIKGEGEKIKKEKIERIS